MANNTFLRWRPAVTLNFRNLIGVILAGHSDQ